MLQEGAGDVERLLGSSGMIAADVESVNEQRSVEPIRTLRRAAKVKVGVAWYLVLYDKGSTEDLWAEHFVGLLGEGLPASQTEKVKVE